MEAQCHAAWERALALKHRQENLPYCTAITSEARPSSPPDECGTASHADPARPAAASESVYAKVSTPGSTLLITPSWVAKLSRELSQAASSTA